MQTELMDDKQTATKLGVTTGSLANWRCSGLGGPKYIKVGRRVRYRLRDIEEYLDRQTVTPKGCEVRS